MDRAGEGRSCPGTSSRPGPRHARAPASGPSLTLKEIAAEEGSAIPTLRVSSRLAFLAPDIVTAILDGRHPPQLTANRLMDDTRLPLDWRHSANCSALKAHQSPRFTRVSGLASRSLAKKCGVGRETVVLPKHAARDEARRDGRLAHQNVSSYQRLMRAACKARKTRTNCAARSQKSLLYQWLNCWRRGWDSNPRYGYPYNGFRDRPIRPLWHLSVPRSCSLLPATRQPEGLKYLG